MKVKYTCSAMPFKQMENIATFLHALSKLPNFRSFDLFSTVDLYEGKNMAQVIRCVLACKRFAEKEALSKGLAALKVTEECAKKENNEDVNKVEEINVAEQDEEDNIEDNVEPEIEEVEESLEQLGNDVETIENEQMEYETSKSQSKTFESEADEMESQTEQPPEIVLIDSPVYADDESEDHFNHSKNELEVEYETFTEANPGTFEIEVSN